MLALSPFLLASALISGSLAATFNVEVGNGGTVFNPPTVNAAAGDEVVFTFFPKNHTLTQSTLAAPCSPLAGGGDSGYMPVAADAATKPTRRLIVPNADTPLWFYCAQGAHCQSGMVFSINPKSAEQQAQFVANAKAFVAGAPGTTTTTPPATSTPPVVGTTQTVPPASTTPAPTTGGTGTGNILEVVVGQGGLTFTPDRLTAAVGDTINFKFVGGAHTVTQSTFGAPCSALSGGFDSGSKPATAAAPVNVTYTVTDASKPQWFFCATGTHCRSGMVFSLNAPATGNTADAFKAAAISGTTASNTTDGNTTTPDSATSVSSGLFGLLVAASLAGLLL